MAEIHVPPDAQSTLDEIIELSQRVEENQQYYRQSIDEYGHRDATRFKQEYEKLMSKLITLGHQWCGMNPIKYQCTTANDIPNSTNLWFFVEIKEFPSYDVEFRVPYEIHRIIKGGENFENLDDRNGFVSMVRENLTSLKEKVIIQARQAAKSARPDHAVVMNQDEKDEIIEPMLINAGRTIVCSKGTFNFTEQQAKVNKIMWEKGINSQEYYPEQDILEEAGFSTTSFANLFKSRRDSFSAIFERHKTERGLWRLNLG